mmetsp:Transcript_10589/g.65172  ORF Transcript_10589/g.65172 Transcript_10589/m.65172 type:complete len:376 (-) Transcript_10589:1210-2337(-)
MNKARNVARTGGVSSCFKRPAYGCRSRVCFCASPIDSIGFHSSTFGRASALGTSTSISSRSISASFSDPSPSCSLAPSSVVPPGCASRAVHSDSSHWCRTGGLGGARSTLATLHCTSVATNMPKATYAIPLSSQAAPNGVFSLVHTACTSTSGRFPRFPSALAHRNVMWCAFSTLASLASPIPVAPPPSMDASTLSGSVHHVTTSWRVTDRHSLSNTNAGTNALAHSWLTTCLPFLSMTPSHPNFTPALATSSASTTDSPASFPAFQKSSAISPRPLFLSRSASFRYRLSTDPTRANGHVGEAAPRRGAPPPPPPTRRGIAGSEGASEGDHGWTARGGGTARRDRKDGKGIKDDVWVDGRVRDDPTRHAPPGRCA